MNRNLRAAGLAALLVASSSAALVHAQVQDIVGIHWKQISGSKATDISTNANPMGGPSAVWVVGATETGDNNLYEWKDGRFWSNQGSMRCVRVDVDLSRQPWCVDSKGTIKRRIVTKDRASIDHSYPEVPGPKAKDLGIGRDGTLWVIGLDSKIHRRRGGAWEAIAGTAERIDVDDNGAAWIVQRDGDVLRFAGGGFQKVPGLQGVDVGIGGKGAVYVTGKDGFAYKWTGKMDKDAWAKTDGLLTTATEDGTGYPVGINAKNDVFFSEKGAIKFRVNVVTKGKGKVRLSSNDKDCSQGCTVSTNEHSVTLVWDGKEGSFDRWEGADCGSRKACHVRAGDSTTQITAIFK